MQSSFNIIKKSIYALPVLFISISLLSCGKKTDGLRSGTDAAPLPPLSGKVLNGDQERFDSYVFSVQKLKEKYNEVIVLDARSKDEYKKGHLPGAVQAHWTDWSDVKVKQGERGWAVILPPAALKLKLGALGIDGKKPVVIYIDTLEGWGEDGRQLWGLRLYGLKNTFILDGGIKAWKASGGGITRALPKITAVAGPELLQDTTLFAGLEDIRAKAGSLNILDVRGDDEFAGLKVYGEKKKGRIPGSRHIWFKDFYNADGSLQTPSQIRARLESLGFSAREEVISYCTGGIRSGLATIALRIAGYDKARNYNAGFSEWAGTGQEIDTGVPGK